MITDGWADEIVGVDATTGDNAPRGWHPAYSDYFTIERLPAVTTA